MLPLLGGSSPASKFRQVEQGGFTGAGSADNCEKTARIQVKTDPVQSVNLALADVIYLF